MDTILRCAPIALMVVTLFAPSGIAQNPTPTSSTPAATTAAAANPSPDLVGRLTKKLSITPEQATGGAGAIFGLAKSRLSADQFGKVAAAVPGMDGLLKAAPAPSASTAAMGALGSALPSNVGGLASLAGSFKSLGLSPEMASKMVPILTNFVSKNGGKDVGSLFAGALK